MTHPVLWQGLLCSNCSSSSLKCKSACDRPHCYPGLCILSCSCSFKIFFPTTALRCRALPACEQMAFAVGAALLLLACRAAADPASGPAPANQSASVSGAPTCFHADGCWKAVRAHARSGNPTAPQPLQALFHVSSHASAHDVLPGQTRCARALTRAALCSGHSRCPGVPAPLRRRARARAAGAAGHFARARQARPCLDSRAAGWRAGAPPPRHEPYRPSPAAGRRARLRGTRRPFGHRGGNPRKP